tara:strand:+ start:431 stop:538 length:108 start_codon:yes stop_codon:yes gene_type:complete
MLTKPIGSYAIEQETPEKEKERKNPDVYIYRNSDW